MVHVTVQGGTGAGRKRPLREAAKDWRCWICGRLNKGYHARCMAPGCNRKREV